MDKILLVDFNNQVWRSAIKFGKPLDIDDSILFTYNFFKNLRPLVEQFSPDKLFFALEGHPQFRYDLYPEYKANRIIKTGSKQNTKTSVLAASKIVIELSKFLPITICRAEKYEADDLISTLCNDMKGENITIISNDSDYIQLLQKGLNIKIYNPIKKSFMNNTPYPYIAWKSLDGDKSDNIKRLLTEAKALKTVNDPVLFKQFLSIEENRANFNVNRQLIEFKDIDSSEIQLEEGNKNYYLLREEFRKYKFDSITNDNSWSKFTATFDCINF